MEGPSSCWGDKNHKTFTLYQEAQWPTLASSLLGSLGPVPGEKTLPSLGT